MPSIKNLGPYFWALIFIHFFELLGSAVLGLVGLGGFGSFLTPTTYEEIVANRNAKLLDATTDQERKTIEEEFQKEIVEYRKNRRPTYCCCNVWFLYYLSKSRFCIELVKLIFRIVLATGFLWVIQKHHTC